MTKEQAKAILISRKNSYLSNTEMAKAIDVAIQALTDRSTPTDTARAEDVINQYIQTEVDFDYSPSEMMVSTGDALAAMIQFAHNEAAPIRAEVERLQKVLDDWKKQYFTAERARLTLSDELSAANQRIAELEKQIESNKKALASNGTISGTGTARFSARTNSLRSMYSNRLPGIGK